MQTRIDTTFSGKDISSALSVYEYTVPGDGEYTFQLRIASLAGDADYSAWLTLNMGDALGDEVIVDKTTYTAASGETAIIYNSIPIKLIEDDVVNIFALGDAADTSVGGNVRIFYENVPVEVWDELLTGSTHNIATSAGRRLRQLGQTVFDEFQVVSA